MVVKVGIERAVASPTKEAKDRLQLDRYEPSGRKRPSDRLDRPHPIPKDDSNRVPECYGWTSMIREVRPCLPGNLVSTVGQARGRDGIAHAYHRFAQEQLIQRTGGNPKFDEHPWGSECASRFETEEKDLLRQRECVRMRVNAYHFSQFPYRHLSEQPVPRGLLGRSAEPGGDAGCRRVDRI
ncbi:MAG TPA: hypothetical protein VFK32_00030, partial [Tepidiformaceae bacterium]|nr:hypothetical protein [Tepidiformaceae bacterium]